MEPERRLRLEIAPLLAYAHRLQRIDGSSMLLGCYKKGGLWRCRKVFNPAKIVWSKPVCFASVAITTLTILKPEPIINIFPANANKNTFPLLIKTNSCPQLQMSTQSTIICISRL